MTHEELDAIKKRAEAATEGPWKWEGDKFGDIVIYSPEYRGFHNNGGEIAELNYGSESDAEFIANARQDIPNLLAEIDRIMKKFAYITELALEFYEHDGVNNNGTTVVKLDERFESRRGTIQEILVIASEEVSE